VELLKSSSFNTAAHPGILKQSDPAIQDRYRRVVGGTVWSSPTIPP